MTLLNSVSHVLIDAEPVSAAERWSVRLNQLCLQGLAPWLADEFGITAEQVEAAARAHRTIWLLVDGSAISTGDGTRLVLIPSAAIDQSELRVPQEWVDILDWVGDYYAAVQVNPASGQLCVWGYTTHAKLKRSGRYDTGDRSYCLDGEDLIDLAILPTSRALGLSEATRADVPNLPKLNTAQIDSLVQRLADALTPRLLVPFETWGALLQDQDARWRSLSGADPQMLSTVQTNVSQWLTHAGETLAQGWQTIESLLSPTQAALAFRAGETASAVLHGKRLSLASETVILLVAVETEADERLSIRVQLRPEPEASLPEDLELSLLSPNGEVVQTVARQPQDSYIQLKRFRLPTGYSFTIQVRQDLQTVQEPLTT